MDLSLLGITPISEDNPVGSDIRYEPEFDQIQTEIDKLSSPSASALVDWKKVIDLATEILSKKSKDILITSYLGAGLINTKQIEGLAISINIFADLIGNFWEDLYPSKKRIKGRLNAIRWWVEKSEAVMSDIKPSPIPQEELDKIMGNLGKIESLLEEYSEDMPSFQSIRRFLTSIPIERKGEPELEGKPSTEGIEDKGIRKDLKDMAEIPEEIKTLKDAQRLLSFSLQKVRQTASYLIREEPSNPQGYRLIRIAVWSNIDALPPATDGKTRIPPPPGQLKTILADLNDKGEWEKLLKSSEQKIGQFIFWLDLNWYTATALAGLGGDYSKAHEAVCQETAFFVNKLPGLEYLSFSDNTPFAGIETVQWLKEAALQRADSVKSPSVSGLEGDFFQEELKKVKELAIGKQIKEAVNLLQKNLKGASSQKERLLWRLELIQFLIRFKKPHIAIPHLDQILQDMETYRLEEWDPELALRVLKTVWTGFSMQTDQTSKGKALGILTRIAKLNPSEAIGMEKD